MEKKLNPNTSNQEEGEELLSTLIKQAGNEARTRRKKALDEHFNKLKEVIAEAVSHQKKSIPT